MNALAIRAGLALVATLTAAAVDATPCAGFSDVDGASAFCPSVEWQKNRGVTLGCGDGTIYCPDSAVSRLAMAAFMKRLGAALTPVPLVAEETTGARDLDTTPVVCATAPFAVTGYPRRAYADAGASVTGASDLDFGLAIVSSTDGGATWSQLHAPVRSAVPANRWGYGGGVGYADLSPGESVTFGIRLSRADAGSADVDDARCSLRVTIYSRDGASSPF